MPHEHCPVFEYFGPANNCAVLLTCEHAGRRIPKELNGLGLPEEEVRRHIGWDIGAEGVCRELRNATGAALFIGRYSRLVVDLNRPEHSPECVIGRSDGTEIPGNIGLSENERLERVIRFHRPFHRKLAEIIEDLRPAAILPIHTFTPALKADRVRRPWHCSVLYMEAISMGRHFIEYLRSFNGLVVGENVPYQIDLESDYTVPIHGDGRDIPTVLLEIRQDLVEDERGQKRWALILGGHARQVLALESRRQASRFVKSGRRAPEQNLPASIPASNADISGGSNRIDTAPQFHMA